MKFKAGLLFILCIAGVWSIYQIISGRDELSGFTKLTGAMKSIEETERKPLSDPSSYVIPKTAPLPAKKLQKLVSEGNTLDHHENLLERTQNLNTSLVHIENKLKQQGMAIPNWGSIVNTNNSLSNNDQQANLKQLQAIKDHLNNSSP